MTDSLGLTEPQDPQCCFCFSSSTFPLHFHVTLQCCYFALVFSCLESREMRRIAVRGFAGIGCVGVHFVPLPKLSPSNCRRYSDKPLEGIGMDEQEKRRTEAAMNGIVDDGHGKPFNFDEFLKSVNQEDLKAGDDMPPLLQYNQPLVDAGLALLETSSSISDLTPAEESALEAVTEMLFKETSVPVTQQVKVTSAVLDHERLRNDERIREAIYTS